MVRRIKNGSVIDHIESGKAFLVLKALNITGREGNVITVALNVPSNKYEKKDIIKVENRYLKPDETNKLSLIAPHATINIIKEYKLAEKRKIQSPDYITGIFKCPNLRCVTNGENIKSVIEIMDKDKMILRCKYCGRILSIDELII
ncbi:MAG TPA: aspartate carbamoyltransferase regulatory subunit [Nitrososphaeraceae archaeon]